MKQLKKILYAEDDVDIAEITKMILCEVGQYEVMHASNGIEAVKLFKEFEPEFVLMDVMMPIMDGQEAFIEIKKNNPNLNAPVVFMTAKAQNHEQKKYMDLGAAGVIVKPFDLELLCETIENYWKELSNDTK